METHDLMGGKLHVYKRENSRYWQCSTYLAGKNRRMTTKEESLSHAKEIAEDWYLELRGKARAGQLVSGPTFKRASILFLPSSMRSLLVSVIPAMLRIKRIACVCIWFRSLEHGRSRRSLPVWCRTIGSPGRPIAGAESRLREARCRKRSSPFGRY